MGNLLCFALYTVTALLMNKITTVTAVLMNKITTNRGSLFIFF